MITTPSLGTGCAPRGDHDRGPVTRDCLALTTVHNDMPTRMLYFSWETIQNHTGGTEIMARTLQHNRSSTALDARPGTLQDRNGKTPGSMQGITKGCNPEKRFTPVDVEYSVLRALTPALLARAGTCYSFADWTMAGEGIIIVLENGQEFRMEITEAK